MIMNILGPQTTFIFRPGEQGGFFKWIILFVGVNCFMPFTDRARLFLILQIASLTSVQLMGLLTQTSTVHRNLLK